MTNYLVNVTGMFCIVRAKDYDAAWVIALRLVNRPSQILEIRVATETEYQFFRDLGGVKDGGLI